MVEHERTGPVDWITWSFSRVAMWAPAAIVTIIFYEVFMRYILFKPTLWVNEMSLWIGGMIYVTSGLYAMQQRSHIRIYIVYDLAPLWLRRVFDVLSVVCVCIFVIAVIWGGFGEAAAKFFRWETFGTAFDPPIPATDKPLVLITLFVLALQAVSNLIRDWPSNPIVRKAFDIGVTLLIIYCASLAIEPLMRAPDEGSSVPFYWRVGLGITLAVAVLLSVVGLIVDFNRTPTPMVESHDPADEFDLPDEVLTGQPPAVDAASGKIDDEKK
ncbi:MAG: TRAP transporter small permease subunit [Rhizobiaceae bacterium]